MRCLIFKKKFYRVASYLLTGLIFLASCRSSSHITQNSQEELLAIWGKDPQNETCLVVVFNPVSQEQVVSEQKLCELSVIEAGRESRIALTNKELGMIEIFTVNSTEGLRKEYTYFLEDIRITSKPIMDGNGLLYVNGIANGKEQIFQLTKNPNNVTALPLSKNGAPILSPANISGNDYFIYYNLEGKETRFDCRLDCYPYFKLYNTVTGTHLDLKTILPQNVSPFFTHCRELWSPDRTYLAFTVGCDSETPSQIVILDVLNQKVTQVIDPLTGDHGIESIAWLSNTQLIFRFGSKVNYTLFSITDGKISELPGLSLEQKGKVFNIDELDLNSATRTFAGTSIGDTLDFQTRSIVLGKVMDNVHQTTTFMGEQCNLAPKLSLSGKWIAYSSARDCNNAIQDGVTIGLLNQFGNIVTENMGDFEWGVEYYWVYAAK